MQLDATEQIERFKEFFSYNYEDSLHHLSSHGINVIRVDFPQLAKFDPESADQLLEEPEEVIRAAELAVDTFDLQLKNFRVRFYNLPRGQFVFIRDIRSSHLNKFMVIEGIVRQSSDVRPQVTSAKFECPSCGNLITILQLDSRFKEPTRCSCGRRGKFRLISKDLVDAQRLVLEEIPESLEGGEQPKRLSVFLREDLVEPKMEKKTTPGSKVIIYGIVKEVPILLRTGAQSIRYDLMMEANNIESIEKSFGELELDETDEKEIKKLSQDPRIFDKLVKSIAPSIYGHEKIKEALILQLMGGVRKFKEDGTTTRGDIHILLVGDPGCIAGDSQVALYYKGIDKIKNLGKKHLQPIKEFVTKIRKNKNDKPYDVATVFHKYKQQPVLKVVTETGKEIICTYNQPFLTKTGWKRADDLILDTEIRVIPKIPNNIKKLAATNFSKVKRKFGHLKEIFLLDKLTPELASLYGYIIGDGNIHPRGYRVTCYINDGEIDLIEKISGLWEKTFGVEPAYFSRNAGEKIKTIYDRGRFLRRFKSKQKIHILEVNSKQVANSLSFLSNKRVPQEIFKSPNNVIAKFISWLFDADGCVFGNGRGRTAIQLKSVKKELLKDVQLLLLYFGIHSRIIGDNLCIRRSNDIELFAKFIGFNSKKKEISLKKVLESIKNKSSIQKRRLFQRYEKIKEITPSGIMDVYDFEVLMTHTFMANGIVCHNSGKSQMLTFISKIAPKARLVSGKGATGAGLTATVVKDEFLRGWALEAGALVLANGGIAVIDELDKMNPEDRDALHEALEQQRISISKANIQATLRAETTVLAAANPKLGRFDPYASIPSQIDLPATLINRFDLIFPIRDLPNRELDEKIAGHVLNLQQNPEDIKTEISGTLLKKYLSYARKQIIPKLTDSAINEIKEFYITLRNTGQKGDSEIRPIPISARQLEALVRLSEASARLRLSESITKDDAKRAIELLRHCLMQVSFDFETGQIDIDRIATGVPASQRSRIVTIREIIKKLESKIGKIIPIADIINEAREQNINEAQVEEIIEQLKREAELFEPKRSMISRL